MSKKQKCSNNNVLIYRAVRTGLIVSDQGRTASWPLFLLVSAYLVQPTMHISTTHQCLMLQQNQQQWMSMALTIDKRIMDLTVPIP